MNDVRFSRYYHFGVDLRAALKRIGMEEWDYFIKANETATPTAREVRAEFQGLVDKGVFYLPIGTCDNWNPTQGCGGHMEPPKE